MNFWRRQPTTGETPEKFTHRRPERLSGRPWTLRAALLAVLLAAGPAAGDVRDGLRDSRYETGSKYSASIGSVTVQERQLYRLALRPQFPLGRAAVVMDLELFIGDDGSVESLGWSFATPAETFDSLLRKIYYVRYGEPREPAFVRVGALDRVTLGYGLIMDRYRNTLEYPGIKRTGAVFHFDRLAGNRFGVQGMVNNVQDFQQGGAVLGTRLFTYVGERVELGATYVLDINQYAGLLDRDDDGYPDAVDAFPGDDASARDNDGDGVPDSRDIDDDNDGVIDFDPRSGLSRSVVNGLEALEEEGLRLDRDVQRTNPFNKDEAGADRFGILGVDAGYHWKQGAEWDLTLYGQLGILHDDDDELTLRQARVQNVSGGNRRSVGLGIAAPGLRARTGAFEGRMEYRYFLEDFEAGYFDNLYDLDRARLDRVTGRATPKDAGLTRGQSLQGVYGRVAASLFGLATGSADYEHLLGDNASKRQFHGSMSLSPVVMKSVRRLSHLAVHYQKNHIGRRLDSDGTPGSEDAFLESTEDTFYGYSIGFEMDGAAVYLDTHFLFDREADGRLRRRQISSIETVLSF